MKRQMNNYTLQKFKTLYAAAPWLQTSKNIIHMSILDPNRPTNKPTQTLPGVTWAELYEYISEIK